MTCTVNCAFARVAVRQLVAKHSPRTTTRWQVLNDFTTQFKHFMIDLSTAKKRFPLVNKVPDDAKHTYLSTFSIKCWPESEKKHHTLRDCKACQSFYGNLPSLFPCAKVAAENQITIIVDKNTTPQQVGKQILGPLVEHTLGTTIQQVLINTPTLFPNHQVLRN